MRGHLWLVGMMGSGKTRIGSRLAADLHLGFIDVDQHIAKRMGCSISQLWGERGEAAFRDLEEAAIDRIADGAPSVIATGGGAIVRSKNVERMRASGAVVWLDARVDTLARRVGQGRGRPLLADVDPADRLEEILARRAPLYEAAADLRVVTDDRDPEDVTSRIEAWWNAS